MIGRRDFLAGAAAGVALGGFARRAQAAEAEGGDFFRAVPAGGDLYLLKFILHDWDDASSIKLLKNILNAMSAKGRLAIVELVLPQPNEPHIGPLMDLNMMVMTGGVERTAEEYGALLAKAGFRLERNAATRSPFSVIEAAPV
jgi:hypothetical protein